MKGSGAASMPVIDGRVAKVKLVEDLNHLISMIDDKNSRIDEVEKENGSLNRENVALRQLLSTRWSSLGYSLGVPGGVVAFIIKDVDGNRLEVAID